jgi:hypothetical protein
LSAHLRRHVAALEGPRHRLTAPQALERAARYIVAGFRETGLDAERRRFSFGEGSFANVVATRRGTRPDLPRVLIGAHYDTVAGTPGADDNASGVAVLLEAARLLSMQPCDATIEFVGFALEESQGTAYGVGSRAFAEAARRGGDRYAGALILEMVGYTDPRPGSQIVPPLLWWKRIPRRGTFLAAAGDGRSGGLLRAFTQAAGLDAPDLEIVTVRVPLRGWLLPVTRLSDNRSFWDAGYPALMITDTAFLRNPHYHRESDRLETLDFDFMGRVSRVVAGTAWRLAGGGSG